METREVTKLKTNAAGIAPALPKSVRVGPLVYTIKRWSHMAGDNSEAYGLCDRTTCVILVREDLSPQKAAEVLWHEVLHAAYSGAGLTVGEHFEERTVNALTYTTLQVIKDNPDLLVYLTEALDA